MHGEKGMPKVIGLIGYPVRKNLSAFMHNAGFKKLNLDYIYLLFEVKPINLKEAVQGMKVLNFAGFNITVPFKEEIIPLLDEMTVEANEIGAVNTVWRDKKGRLVGDNTDGKGFIQALKMEKGIDPSGKKIFLLGSGGAARAIAITLVKEKISELYLIDLDKNKAESLAIRAEEISKKIGHKLLKLEVIEASDYQRIKKIVNKIDILVNATPVGMYSNPDNIPIPIEVLNPHILVYDIINNPYKTKFLQLAEQLGTETLNGLPMLAYQGVEAFNRWTGKDISVELFKKIARKYVEEYSFI